MAIPEVLKRLPVGSASASSAGALGSADIRAAVAVLAVAVWSLSDFVCTVIAWRLGWMHEANPIARPMLEAGAFGSLLIFRIGVVAAGTLILFALRHHATARIGLAAAVVVHAGLMAWWSAFWLLA